LANSDALKLAKEVDPDGIYPFSWNSQHDD
jgi:hypothetical protein